MRRNIFHDKTNTTHTEIGKMIFRITSFEEILNYFKLGNNWLNSKLCAKRKLLRSDENAHVFFVKKEALNSLGNFVPLYFSPNVDIFITALPRSCSRARKLGFFSNFSKLLYKLQTFSVVIWIQERKHKFLKIYCNLSLICSYIILFMT